MMRVLTVTRKRLLVVLFCTLAAVLAAVACVRGVQAVQASASKRLVPIYNVKTEEKKIAISFDAAWGNEETQPLIDILKEYNVKTTFFVVGAWVDKYPESVKALVDAGHEVCNHSDTHPHMPKLSQDDMKKQIAACNEKIKSVAGKSPVLFRPPYGDYNNAVVRTVQDLHMYPIQWDVETYDIRVICYLKNTVARSGETSTRVTSSCARAFLASKSRSAKRQSGSSTRGCFGPASIILSNFCRLSSRSAMR